MHINGKDISSHPLQERPDERSPEVKSYRKTATVLAAPATDFGEIDTIDGHQTFKPGDYIVSNDPPTEAWAVPAEIFEKTHEEIP
jgi:hypothetical protein